MKNGGTVALNKKLSVFGSVETANKIQSTEMSYKYSYDY